MGQYDEFFDEEYLKQVDKLEEWELEKINRLNKLGMVYATKTTKAGDQMELDIYPTFWVRHDGARKKKTKASREAQKNLNDRRSRRHLADMINTNFGKGDLWCTFTYDDNHLPENADRAKRMFGNFVKRVNRWRAKKGLGNLKYIVVTEWDDDPEAKVRVHHHAVIKNDMGDEGMGILNRKWGYGGRNNIREAQPDENGLTGMALYMAKGRKNKSEKHFSSSRNLKKPTVTKALGKFSRRRVEKMTFDPDYRKEIIEKKYPGYRYLDAEPMVNKVNGGFYLYVRMTRT